MATCNHPQHVERYGGGTRFYCPKCDVRFNGYIHVITWTNGTPNKPAFCLNQVEPQRRVA